jgi:uncharacterized protein YukE
MTTASSAMRLAELTKPSDIESEVLDAIDARQKLNDELNAQELKRKEAELDLAKTFERDTCARSIDLEAAFQQNEAWRATDERFRQRIEALESVLDKVKRRIEKLKTENHQAVKSALTRKIEALEKDLKEKVEATRDLIKKLQGERDRLTEAAAKAP